MSKRKRIALLSSLPEGVHARRVTEGILQQCEKYDYDLCVFGALTHLQLHRKTYVSGEMHIFRLCNFAEMDGVILDTTTLLGDHEELTVRSICERLSAFPELPVCAMEMPIGDYHLIEASGSSAMQLQP